MATIQQFLDAYKTYETILREQGVDTKIFEEQSDDLTANRLRMCRVMRNYSSHNNDNAFLSVSDTQLKFLQKVADEQRMSGDVVKKHLKSVKTATCTLKDKCTDVLQRMIKLHVTALPVWDKDVLGIVSIYDVSTLVLESRTKKISDVKKLGKDFIIVAPDMKWCDLPKHTIAFCTKDGTPDTSLLGVVLLS